MFRQMLFRQGSSLGLGLLSACGTSVAENRAEGPPTVLSVPPEEEPSARASKSTPQSGCPAETPRLDDIRARFEETRSCFEVLGVDESLAPKGCEVSELGNGSTLLVYAQTECGGDSCSGHTWLINDLSCGPLRLDDEFGTFEAAPDGSFLLVDEPLEGPEMTATGPVSDFGLTQVMIPSLERHRFARCMSARLSPGGRWILCRNRQADVLKVPLTGGPPEVVARVGAEDARFVPYAQIYPDAVSFPSATELVYTVDEQSADAPTTRSIAWRE